MWPPASSGGRREPAAGVRRLSIQFLAVLVLLTLLGVALATLALAEGPVPPRLSIETVTRSPRQGSVLPLAIRSDRPLASLTLLQGDGAIPVELAEGGTLGRALVGIDMDTTLGDLALRLEAVAADGAAAPVAYSLDVVSGAFRVQRLQVRRGYVELPAEVLERVRADQAAVRQVWENGDAERRWRGPFRRPVEAEPSDNFGVRRIFNGQPRTPHNGVDFGAPTGTPVVAPAEARVAMADDLYFSGGTIILDHGAGLYTTYFHLSRLDVAVGEVVHSGELIGAVGSTGRSTGPHLHWGARLHAARVNPLDLLTLPEWGGTPAPVTPSAPVTLPAATTAEPSPAAPAPSSY